MTKSTKNDDILNPFTLEYNERVGRDVVYWRNISTYLYAQIVNTCKQFDHTEFNALSDSALISKYITLKGEYFNDNFSNYLEEGYAKLNNPEDKKSFNKQFADAVKELSYVKRIKFDVGENDFLDLKSNVNNGLLKLKRSISYKKTENNESFFIENSAYLSFVRSLVSRGETDQTLWSDQYFESYLLKYIDDGRIEADKLNVMHPLISLACKFDAGAVVNDDPFPNGKRNYFVEYAKCEKISQYQAVMQMKRNNEIMDIYIEHEFAMNWGGQSDQTPQQIVDDAMKQGSNDDTENIMDLFRERVLNMYNISLAASEQSSEGNGFPKQLTKHITKNIKIEVPTTRDIEQCHQKVEQMNNNIYNYITEIEETEMDEYKAKTAQQTLIVDIDDDLSPLNHSVNYSTPKDILSFYKMRLTFENYQKVKDIIEANSMNTTRIYNELKVVIPLDKYKKIQKKKRNFRDANPTVRLIRLGKESEGTVIPAQSQMTDIQNKQNEALIALRLTDIVENVEETQNELQFYSDVLDEETFDKVKMIIHSNPDQSDFIKTQIEGVIGEKKYTKLAKDHKFYVKTNITFPNVVYYSFGKLFMTLLPANKKSMFEATKMMMVDPKKKFKDDNILEFNDLYDKFNILNDDKIRTDTIERSLKVYMNILGDRIKYNQDLLKPEDRIMSSEVKFNKKFRIYLTNCRSTCFKLPFKFFQSTSPEDHEFVINNRRQFGAWESSDTSLGSESRASSLPQFVSDETIEYSLNRAGSLDINMEGPTEEIWDIPLLFDDNQIIPHVLNTICAKFRYYEIYETEQRVFTDSYRQLIDDKQFNSAEKLREKILSQMTKEEDLFMTKKYDEVFTSLYFYRKMMGKSNINVDDLKIFYSGCITPDTTLKIIGDKFNRRIARKGVFRDPEVKSFVINYLSSVFVMLKQVGSVKLDIMKIDELITVGIRASNISNEGVNFRNARDKLRSIFGNHIVNEASLDNFVDGNDLSPSEKYFRFKCILNM
ncbi:MAG: hypothetical protein JKX76_01445 [Colwellia sp.]|nr:hypothetical protein [Colwellia sp.]